MDFKSENDLESPKIDIFKGKRALKLQNQKLFFNNLKKYEEKKPQNNIYSDKEEILSQKFHYSLVPRRKFTFYKN